MVILEFSSCKYSIPSDSSMLRYVREPHNAVSAARVTE